MIPENGFGSADDIQSPRTNNHRSLDAEKERLNSKLLITAAPEPWSLTARVSTAMPVKPQEAAPQRPRLLVHLWQIEPGPLRSVYTQTAECRRDPWGLNGVNDLLGRTTEDSA